MKATGAGIRHRICPFREACWGLPLTIADGRVSRVRGHAADAFSAGDICPKGAAIKQRHGDPDRLRRPLLKREGCFVEVGRDETFAGMGRRLPPILPADLGRVSADLAPPPPALPRRPVRRAG
jgi:anaerobic selenocysteine-containing dehydrogenase